MLVPVHLNTEARLREVEVKVVGADRMFEERAKPKLGPFDEAVLLIAAVPLGLFYRAPLVEAWKRAGDARFANRS